MTMTYDAIVIGGGLAGMSVAHDLVSRNLTTLVVDAELPGRATAAGAGILSPETTKNAGRLWYSLVVSCGHRYRQLVPALEEHGIDCGYSPCGLLTLALADWDIDAFDDVARLILGRRAFSSISDDALGEVTPDAARVLFPALGAVTRALYYRDAARVDGRKMCAAVRHVAVANGLHVRTGTVRGLVMQGTTVRAVDVDGDEIAAGATVIAGGAWSAAFANQLGVPVAVAPQRGQIVHLGLDGVETGDWPIVQPVLGHYLVPWPGGRIAVGATVEPEAAFDARVTVAGLRQLLREAARVAPGLADATFLEARVGLRPVSADGDPIVGPVPGATNVHVATGYGADGLLLSPGCGHAVGAGVAGEACGIDISAFSLARFVA